MKASSLILGTSLILSTVSLGVGFFMAGSWFFLLVLVAAGIGAAIAYPRFAYFSASGFLAVSVTLAAAGILLQLPLYLMVVGCTSALVSWDLLLFRQRLAESSPELYDPGLEKYHLQALGLAASSGLFLAITSGTLKLQLPFIVTAGWALMGVGFITVGVRYLMKKNH